VIDHFLVRDSRCDSNEHFISDVFGDRQIVIYSSRPIIFSYLMHNYKTNS